MRISSLFTILLVSLISGCGSDNEQSTSSSSGSIPNLPPIVQGPTNEVETVAGEFYRPNAFVDDANNNRWLFADRIQGVIAIDKTTDARSVLTPLDTSEDGDGIRSIRDFALDPATGSLYVLDTVAKRISKIDTVNGQTTIVKTNEAFDALNDAGWAFPSSLYFDDQNKRLLISDRLGLTAIDDKGAAFLTFCVFIYTPAADSVSIMSEASNRASPILKTEIFDIHFDAESGNLLAEGLYYVDSQSAYYAGLKIPESDWSKAVYFHLNLSGKRVTSAALHSITYEPATSTAFIVNSVENLVYGFDLTTDTYPMIATIVTAGDDGKAFPFKRPVSIDFNAINGLMLLDESTRALTKVAPVVLTDVEAGDSADRILLASGTAISSDPAVVVQSPYDILVEPTNGTAPTLIVTDRYSTQLNTVSYDGQAYSIWPFDYDVSGITPYELTFLETNENIPPPSQPKPLLLSKNAQDDMFIFASGFRLATDNPLKQDSYPFAFYQRLAGETQFKPISTITNAKNELQYLNFESYFTLGEVQDFTVTEGGLVILVNKQVSASASQSYFYYLDLETSKIYFVSDLTGAYNPRSVTGLDISPDNKSVYFVDSDHDSLISITVSVKDKIPQFAFKVLSGRPHSGDAYLAIPWGLVVNKAGTTAWTFENSIRAIVEVDLMTGTRKRIDSIPNYLQSAGRLALSSDENTLYITDKAVNRILKVNLTNADQEWLKP